MRIDLLETYRAILAIGTTQGAALELGVSQSAVSRRLAQLEETLGLTLFIRDKTRLIPTRENRMIQGQIEGLLDRSHRLSARAQELRNGNSSSITLRVAFPSSLTLSVVPRIVAEFLAENDQVKLELHNGPYDSIERMLLDERAEIGFLRHPVQRSGLKTAPLVTSRTVCVVPRGHPLEARGTVSVRDLRGLPLILLGRARSVRQEFEDLFRRSGLRPDIRVEAHSVCSACALVAAGLGVTLVNELMAIDQKHLPITLLPLAESFPHAFAFAMIDDTPPSISATKFMEKTTSMLADFLSAKISPV
ncbi:LysR family transcriptional regulator [Roseibium marinum]|uniref:DNA-binding transcriptional LysR family regulator n=1 Tax=Roseibium marinum TaxID=281252 RepID=A0A2S3V1J0_9HYPH|nr:LysR family transcriptional regulator [Roseibium marinum]POF33818.1 DNA-binding transcriptional LysR family regulator [Roseibium marinum]